ncbi:hypothetical protein DFJ63DRAFT_114852 [Scheffersomyces coipomensis]|uniref:uncharacterized protein n=1 Tax=Scheffersomyces coipomensis TaxID=1788519 RepID=UPI00315C76CB
MLSVRHNIVRSRSSLLSIPIRFNSSNVKKEVSSRQAEIDKQEAAKLAMQSMKDIGSLFSSGSDDATQPIDSTPIFQNPTLFASLSLLHQGQVLAELQDKFNKKWTKLTKEDKLLGYYISYGNWGSREDFINWKSSDEAPYDLPFKLPTAIKSTNPTSTTNIQKLEPNILAETPVRIKQFDMKKMDGVSKFFIYLTVFIAMLAIYRDKNIGEDGKPVTLEIQDQHEIERQKRIELEKKQEFDRQIQEAIALENAKRRKWYYLWLK